jgi:hypothetical protein
LRLPDVPDGWPSGWPSGWFVEEGIGEHRAILIENGAVVAARLHWPGALSAGQIEDAVLIARASGSRRGTLRFASGEQALVDALPREVSEGAPLRAVVTRAAIGENGRHKLAQARPTKAAPCPAPTLAEALRREHPAVRVVQHFPAGEWETLIAEAQDGVIALAGGALTITPTPAMTVIDIDGTLPAPALALAAIPALAGAIRRLDLAGSIGVDFPTLSDKADRRAVDEALGEALAGYPHERTAINGFGFVQIVSRLERPSLRHLAAYRPVGTAARLLMRRAERVTEPGRLLLTCNLAVRNEIPDDWTQDLARRTGRSLVWDVQPALPLSSIHAQAIPS